jgi:hypothetical protein
MISWLASDFFAQSPVLALPVAALLLFMMLFTVMAVRALRLPADEVNSLANLPIASDTASIAAAQRNDSTQKDESHV